MVTVGENAAAPTGDAIDGVGEARADRHHAASEGVLVARFDNQMRVIALERVVDQAEPGPDAAGSKRALDRMDDRHCPKRWQTRSNPDRDVCRHGFAERLPSGVRQPGIRARLATGAGTATAPTPRRGQRQGKLSSATCHLDSATLSFFRGTDRIHG